MEDSESLLSRVKQFDIFDEPPDDDFTVFLMLFLHLTFRMSCFSYFRANTITPIIMIRLIVRQRANTPIGK